MEIKAQNKTKFTFKRNSTAGRYGSFYPVDHDIKLKKHKIGLIREEKPYPIRLKIVKQDIMEDGNPNCTWKWITLKAKFNSIEESKQFVNEHFETINKKWQLFIDKD